MIETVTVEMEKSEAVTFSVIKDNESDLSFEAQNEVLRDALADATQTNAILQNNIVQLKIEHDRKMEGMSKSDTGKIMMDAICEAIDLMNKRRDEQAYRALEEVKSAHGAEYGHREIDPLSPEALMAINL